MKRLNFYLPFEPAADVNYIFLFRLWELAEYDYLWKVYRTVKYDTLKSLAERLRVSYDTLLRERKRKGNELFFAFNTKGKEILLNCCFRLKEKPFIMLTKKEVSFLLEQNDNLLCKYFIYIKYYASKRESSFTQEQFLSAVGYCSNSGKNKQKLTEYNKLLKEKGFINVLTRYSEQEEKKHLFFRFIA